MLSYSVYMEPTGALPHSPVCHLEVARLELGAAEVLEGCQFRYLLHSVLQMGSSSGILRFLTIRISSWFVRFEVFTAVTMKNGVFWNIKTQFVPHWRHITSPLQSPAR
jgi:hypothetical protein